MGTCCAREDQTKTVEKKHDRAKMDEYSISSSIKLKYEIVSNLGSGAFGKVKLYRDKQCHDIKFAIKSVPKSDAFILDEIKILRTIDHPNIVKYFETYEDEHNIFIVMEYIPGETLDRVVSKLGKKRISEGDISKIIRCLLKAVLFLHNINIIHKDLKPENMLFAVPGNYDSLKIIDFGLSSKEAIGKSNDYRVGTTYYMSPEAVNFNALDGKSDVWSIGVIIYKIFTGSYPFDGEKDEAIFEKILKGSYDENKLTKLKSSDEMKDFISKCLKVNPVKRISVEEALHHSWLEKDNEQYEKYLDKDIVVNLSIFARANCFQKEILFYLAKIANDYEIDKYKNVFFAIDTNHNGVIEMEEIFKVLRKYCDISDQEINKLWEGLDFHNDGKVNYSEFLASNVSLKQLSSKERLRSPFDYFDNERLGYISLDGMIKVLKANDLSYDEIALEACFKKYDTQKIDFDLFLKIMAKI